MFRTTHQIPVRLGDTNLTGNETINGYLIVNNSLILDEYKY